jgi:DNA-binding IclR family transcriptional regulator
VRNYALRTGLPGNTANSLRDLGALELALAQVRQLGFANDNEELELGVRCLAVGVYDDQSHLIAGLSISAPSGHMDDRWLVDLRKIAQTISNSLGHVRSL